MHSVANHCRAHHEPDIERAANQAHVTAHDAAHRLARFLFHSTKVGTPPAAVKAALLTAEVPANCPFATGVMLRRPHACACSLVHVDTSRLPADHGRVARSPAAHLVHTAPDLLSELQAAHRLLMLALGCMTSKQQATFAEKSERQGLGTDGATRHHERAAVIAQATGGAS